MSANDEIDAQNYKSDANEDSYPGNEREQDSCPPADSRAPMAPKKVGTISDVGQNQ